MNNAPDDKDNPPVSGTQPLPAEHNFSLRRIVVPIDFSQLSMDALRYAIPMAREFNAQLTLLHVVEPVAPAEFMDSPLFLPTQDIAPVAQQRLETLARQLNVQADLLGQVLVKVGVPFKEICDLAKEIDADLIVLTTHGYTGLKHVFMGSTAERVVRHAPCPVLTVRAKTAGQQ